MTTRNPSKIQQVLDKVTELEHILDKHVSAQEDRDEKVDKLYEMIVTGNGDLSHAERLRIVERYQDNQRKAYLFIGAIIGGDIILRIWQLVN